MIKDILASAVTPDNTVEAMRSAPPMAVAVLTFAGITLQDWAYAVTIAYTLLQTALVVRKIIRDYRNKK